MAPPKPLAELIGSAAALQRAGRITEAIAAYQAILQRWPREADCWYNLAFLQRQARDFETALASYQHALDAGVRDPEEVHLNRGVIYSDILGNPQAGERELRAALNHNPNYVPALLNLAILCEDLGRRAEAQAALAQVLTLVPTHFEALARLANTLSLPGDHAQIIARVATAREHPAATPADRASLGFALGRLLDAMGNYPAAFAAYSRANADSKASAPGVRYDRRAAETLVDQLIASSVAPSTDVLVNPRPVFIIGMFRSGSTLTEQIIARAPNVCAAGELDLLSNIVATQVVPFPQALRTLDTARTARLARAYTDELSRRFAGAAMVTDKRPDNYLYVGLIKAMFPEARIVHTTRDPLDNCLSLFFLHLDHSMSYALDLEDIGHHYLQYRRLMDHWKKAYPNDIYDFNYDAFVRDPALQASRLYDFLGLPWNDEYLNPSTDGAVRTASVWQVREPIYQRSSGRARNYATQLRSLAKSLAAQLPPDDPSGEIRP